jgi:plasmid stability protein
MPTSITVDQIDDATFERLRVEAGRRGLAVAAVAGEALRRGLPPLPPVPAEAGDVEYNDLDFLAGTWSEADAAAFAAATAGFEIVDKRLWE